MQDEPTPNGHAPAPTSEELHARLSVLEYTLGEDVRGVKRELSDIRPALIQVGGEQKRQGNLLALVAQAVGVRPEDAGPPPDLSGALRALEDKHAALVAKDADLEQRVAEVAKWPQRIAHGLSSLVSVVAKHAPRIVTGLGLVAAAIWGVKQAIADIVPLLERWLGGP